MSLQAGMRVGMRVVIRYSLDDGRATDALGRLTALSETHVVVETKRGPEQIELSRVIASKEVPPPPKPRR